MCFPVRGAKGEGIQCRTEDPDWGSGGSWLPSERKWRRRGGRGEREGGRSVYPNGRHQPGEQEVGLIYGKQSSTVHLKTQLKQKQEKNKQHERLLKN